MKKTMQKLPQDVRIIRVLLIITAAVTFVVETIFLILYLIRNINIPRLSGYLAIRVYDILYAGFLSAFFFLIINLLVLLASMIAAYKYKSYKDIIIKRTWIPLINIPVGILYYNLIF